MKNETEAKDFKLTSNASMTLEYLKKICFLLQKIAIELQARLKNWGRK